MKSKGIEQLSWLDVAGFNSFIGCPAYPDSKKTPKRAKQRMEQMQLISLDQPPKQAKPEKKKRVVYHGKYEDRPRLANECEIKEVRRPGCGLVSVELKHKASGYCDRIVLCDTKENKSRIKEARKQLMTRFQIEKRMGTHVEQRFHRGHSEEAMED